MNMSNETQGWEGQITQLQYMVQYIDVDYRTTRDLSLHNTYDKALCEVNELTDSGDYKVDDVTMFNIDFVNVVVQEI